MAKKTATNAQKAAYGNRFSQQDLTVANENQNPQPLVTPQSKSGGVEFLATLARNLSVRFAGGGTSKTQARKERRIK